MLQKILKIKSILNIDLIQYMALIMWVVMSIISINHIFKICDKFFLPTRFLGWIAWATFFVTIIYLSKKFLKYVSLIFSVFFLLGSALGPYLEPISDPVMHLDRTYERYCNTTSEFIPKKNLGFWHYSMSSILLCTKDKICKPESVLFRIDILNGLFWGVLVAGLFILSKYSGLPDRWAILASIMAFLFLGTNKFSYFRYYSLGPTCTNLFIYWIWTAVFFFKKKRRYVINGILLAIVCLPILYVNHIQEASFLGFILIVWLALNLFEYIWSSGKKKEIDLFFIKRNRVNPYYYKVLLIITILFFFFILPQIKLFQDFVALNLKYNFWPYNQNLVVHWKDFHLIGKIWGYRINETLGVIGLLPILMGLYLIRYGFIQNNKTKEFRIVIVGVLPLIGYCIPLFNFLWVSNTTKAVYWRLCYSSMFWVTTAYMLYRFESSAYTVFKKILKTIHFMSFLNKDVQSFKLFYFTCCLVTLMLLGGIRSNPVYGKMDFILLDSRPWWGSWQLMIEDVMKRNVRKPVLTDVVTGNVLHGIFNIPISKNYKKIRCRKVSNNKKIDIRKADSFEMEKEFQCIVNLAGFIPSWVPSETNHWHKSLADTSQHYFIDKKSGQNLLNYLKVNRLKNCRLFTADGEIFPSHANSKTKVK